MPLNLDVVIVAVLSIWLGITMLGIRRGVLFYKIMHGLPLGYEGTRQITIGSWGGITYFAAIWPYRFLKTTLINVWTFVPSLLLTLFYKSVMARLVGEAELDQDARETYEELLRNMKESNDENA